MTPVLRDVRPRSPSLTALSSPWAPSGPTSSSHGASRSAHPQPRVAKSSPPPSPRRQVPLVPPSSPIPLPPLFTPPPPPLVTQPSLSSLLSPSGTRARWSVGGGMGGMLVCPPTPPPTAAALRAARTAVLAALFTRSPR
ncbi:hypothetical protein I4F81_005110 [Pyropia yezoensis]|uniref:Uncharacterized protein n=1 Tax=Pyropia yezoensis TaxID=2788 RepID=A0ACC3BYC5_PYRYE|nr:hypothetical protein I4F81_005110 [Neopyropia yezoensis]